MKADISTAGVYTDFQGLARLRNAARDDSPETLRAVAQQFEALFMQMMLKNMRDASFGDDLFDNDQTRFYQEMFDKQISISMSEGKGLGIAEMIVRQLSRQKPDESANTLKPLGKPWSANQSVTQNVTQSLTGEKKINSPADFVHSLRPVAEKVGKKIGIEPDVLLAQAALETGWGKAIIRHPDGRSSYNLFGIKADARWQGERVVSSTIEYENGIAVKRNEAFRSYSGFEESFKDYIDFLKANQRYDYALSQAGNSDGFVNALQEAGYATDPEYAQKISDIMDKPVFSRPGAAVKET